MSEEIRKSKNDRNINEPLFNEEFKQKRYMLFKWQFEWDLNQKHQK